MFVKLSLSSLYAITLFACYVQAQIDYDDIKTPQKAQWVQSVDMTRVPKLPIRKVGSGTCPDSTCDGDDNDRCFESCGNQAGPEDIYGCPLDHQWALTFDDGPSNYTSELLDILDKEQVKATFCVMGSHALQFPDIIKRIYSSGHQIASHTFSHPHLMSLSNEEIIYEVKATEEAIEKAVGIKPHYIRPPFGEADDRVKGLMKAMGYKILLWNVDPTDYDVYMLRDVSKRIQGSFSQAAQGSDTGLNLHSDLGFISLQHDLYKQSIQQVPEIIQLLKGKGYKLLTAAQCNNDMKAHTDLNEATSAPANESHVVAQNAPKVEAKPAEAPKPAQNKVEIKQAETVDSGSSLIKSNSTGYILSFVTLAIYITTFF